MSEDPKPEKKRTLPDALKKNVYQPGKSGNPLGRPPGIKSVASKRISKFSQIFGRAEAPDVWFKDGLEKFKRAGMTVDEFIVLRAKWCLANNVRYTNTSLLMEVLNRQEGKIPLRVISRPGEDGAEDDMDNLSEEELKAYLEDLDRRARLAAEKNPPQLTEGDTPPEKKPDVSGE
jgi:hypothetical protein